MLLKRSILSALLIGAATTSSTFAVPDASSSRTIVNGEESTPGDYPYFVHMGGCGAALVAPDIILTAAHCGDLSGKEVFIGAYEVNSLAEGAQKRYCEQYIVDPLYIPSWYPLMDDPMEGLNNDFAICKLNEPVTIDQSFVMLELNEDDAFPAEGTDLLAMGLGSIFSGGMTPQYLRNVTVQAMSDEDCGYPDSYLTEDVLCAGDLVNRRDTCQGDSGGPLVKRTYRGDGTFVDTHVGVVSYGLGCAHPEYGGLYARTSRRADWIKSTSCLVLNSVASFCDGIQKKPDPSSDTGHHLKIEMIADDFDQWSLQDSNGQFVRIRRYSTEEQEIKVEQLYLNPDECYTWRLMHNYIEEISEYVFYLNGEEIIRNLPNKLSTKTETFCTGPLPEQEKTQAPTKTKVTKKTKAPKQASRA
ncbi:unnamed protein product [Pseudo-nitzschia multistriata]|uniref:Peptidase S1 domain-containing protein n=1 Tax=Pseudo-nitzschia multistriata TaxID=183589 RepID=A0A448ZDI3_9STRA|nr:unnamed protein product [Pseudo-nitzschia multistriata]